jgi:hypothetical protein
LFIGKIRMTKLDYEKRNREDKSKKDDISYRILISAPVRENLKIKQKSNAIKNKAGLSKRKNKYTKNKHRGFSIVRAQAQLINLHKDVILKCPTCKGLDREFKVGGLLSHAQMVHKIKKRRSRLYLVIRALKINGKLKV